MKKLSFLLCFGILLLSSCDDDNIEVNPDYPFEVFEDLAITSGFPKEHLAIEVSITNTFPYPAPEDLAFSARFDSNRKGHVEIGGKTYRAGEAFPLSSSTVRYAYVPEEPGNHSISIDYTNNRGDSFSGTHDLTIYNPALSYTGPSGKDSGHCNDPENPCATISYTIDRASAGDTIHIAEGVYTENIVIEKSLSLHGSGRETTVIQAAEKPNQYNAGRVIVIEGDITVRMTGLTVRNGFSPEEDLNRRGGGIYVFGASLRLHKVALNANRAYYGAGLFNHTGTVSLSRVFFAGNSADKNGGGMLNLGGSATLNHVAFNNNKAGTRGGGMLNNHGPAILRNVSFNNNKAATGGGIHIRQSNPELYNVMFKGNSADTGGGIFSVGGAPILANILLSGNFSTLNGGGMANLNNSSPEIINATFSGNAATQQGGAIYNLDSSPVLKHVIIWKNRANGTASSFSSSVFNGENATPAISYSLIANSGGSTNWESSIGINSGHNLDAPPLFSNPIDPSSAPSTSGNFRLRPNSPAVNAGDPDIDLSGFPGGPENPKDLDNNPRIRNRIIDLGAYEQQD
ncbi:hypothetical protein [Sinomicrobium weinanense]|uniref:DUF1565 domain-containing protein n=1 Tax=Sinomicrobium weinanense TaxID=2842200 RepID=A0A926Q0M9_9FLAO|nr:hypothetical protein [Sinomicrobium weinanense]MBC9795067.1 hypothetical protein [Sinomicrobium weinanense]MBU3123804.1 hypothetical protein [Sinomicrobium weinanense]